MIHVPNKDNKQCDQQITEYMHINYSPKQKSCAEDSGNSTNMAFA